MTANRVLQLAFSHPLLLGQTGTLRGPQTEVGPMLLWLGLAGLAIGALSTTAYYLHRAALQRRLNSHPGLFDALCTLHGLDRGQKTLLRQLVRTRNPVYPAQVFTEPQWLESERLPAGLRAKKADLDKMHKMLFG